MDSIQNLLKDKEGFTKSLRDRHKYVTQEFQDYGYRIALKLGDLKRVSMYIKIAKDKPRAFVEQAYSFAIDYPNAKNRGKLFLWKLKRLESGSDEDDSSVKAKSRKENNV